MIPTGKVRLRIVNMQKDYAMIKDAEKNMTHDDSMLLQEDGRVREQDQVKRGLNWKIVGIKKKKKNPAHIWNRSGDIWNGRCVFDPNNSVCYLLHQR